MTSSLFNVIEYILNISLLSKLTDIEFGREFIVVP